MARLGDVCTVVSGTTPSSNVSEYWDGDINWVTPAELSEDSTVVYESARKITKEAVQKSGLSSFPAGTVLLSSRAPIGKVAIAGTEMYCNQGFKNLICSEKIFNKYLFWFLKAKKEYLNSLGRGATFKEISKSIVENVEIPLPAMDEQKHAAELLDKINELLALRKQQLAKMDELAKARFVEMFENTPEAKNVTMADVCKIITDGTHRPPRFVPVGIPFLFVSNIVSNEISYDAEKFITEETYKELIKRTPIEMGDVLLSTVGSYGHPAVVKSKKPFCFQRHIAYLKPDGETINSEYLRGAILSSNVQRQIDERVKGIAQKTLNLSEIRKIRLPLPPLKLQEQFATFVNENDKLKLTIQQSLAKMEMVKQVLMQKYFG